MGLQSHEIPSAKQYYFQADHPSTVSFPFYMPDFRDNQLWLVSLGYPLDEYVIESVDPVGITDRAHFLWNVQEDLKTLSIIWSPSVADPLPIDRSRPAFTVRMSRRNGQAMDASPFYLRAHPARDGVVEDLYTIRPWELIHDESNTKLDYPVVRLFPNPATDRMWLTASESTQAGTFSLYDLYGRSVLSQALPPMQGGDVQSLDIAVLPGGMYFYIYDTPDSRYTGKVSVVK
jgi:hypothetical protein